MGTALIVDDEDTIREALVFILEDAGFTCQQAANGQEALRQMRASTARLVVVLDLMMPRMDGRAVLEAVESDPWLAKQHAIVLLTAAGKTLPLPLVQLLDRLGVRVVGKPFDLDVLLRFGPACGRAGGSSETHPWPRRPRRGGRLGRPCAGDVFPSRLFRPQEHSRLGSLGSEEPEHVRRTEVRPVGAGVL